MAKLTKNKNQQNNGAKLGTFSGVFTPSILTILGVIMFLRFGFVIGNAGFFQAIGIVILANLISILTTLSLSAMVTNIKVSGGGDYYLISRSLGIEYGASIGVILFFAQSISVAFYVVGFTEGLIFLIPFFAPYARIVSIFICILLFINACRGAEWATKIQYWIMAILFLSIISFVIGSFLKLNMNVFQENLNSAYLPEMDFWKIFAIFFPAVTGFTQGVSMSGDLKEPSKNIPRGTFYAVFLSFLIYLLEVYLFSAAVPHEQLVGDYTVMKKISIFSPLIDLGIFSATISSGLASFVGAPRILQALARDNIFPVLGFFAENSPGKNQEPRRAVFVTLFIALLCIVFFDLNRIAPLVTMFFLLSYGMMNYASFYEDYSNAPSFRPRFKFFHWRLSLLGILVCLGAMFAIDLPSLIFSLLILFAIFKYVERGAHEVSWGDAKRGFYFRKIKDYLLKLEEEPQNIKTWRPYLLVFCGRPKNRFSLVEFGSWLASERGIVTLLNIIPGELKKRINFLGMEEKSLSEFIQKKKLDVFGNVIVAPDYLRGFEMAIQAQGIGALKPNMVLLGWSDQKGQEVAYVDILQSIQILKCNLIILKEDSSLFRELNNGEKTDKRKRIIDIWWRGQQNGKLMILLSYLLLQNESWQRSRIRLFRIVEKEQDREPAIQYLKDFLTTSRIDAEPIVLVSKATPLSIIAEFSLDADLIFLGITIPGDGTEGEFMDYYDHYLEQLPTTILVRAVEQFDIEN